MTTKSVVTALEVITSRDITGEKGSDKI
jgi:hypothetical protein